MALTNLRELVSDHVLANASTTPHDIKTIGSLKRLGRYVGNSGAVKLAPVDPFPSKSHPHVDHARSNDGVQSHRVKARVWIGGGGSSKDDAGPVMGAVFRDMPAPKRRRGFGHYIYRGTRRIAIYK